MLAVADPTDNAARRAAEIVLGADVTIKVASFEDITVALNQRLGEDVEADARPRSISAARRRHRELAGPRQRRAGGSRRQRSPGKGRRTAGQRHSHRALSHRAGGSHAHRRPAAAGRGAGRRLAASRHLPHQDCREPQHRGAPSAAGRRRAAAGRALGYRHSCRDHADAARGIRGHTYPAEGSRAARDRKAGIFAGRRCQDQTIADAAPRHDRHHRADRKRQDHDACDGLVDPERTVPENPDRSRIRSSTKYPGSTSPRSSPRSD